MFSQKSAVFLSSSPPAAGGTNDAELFARVALPAPPIDGLRQRCVRDQVEAMISEHGQPKPTDVFVMNAGGNEVLLAAQAGAAVEPLLEAAEASVEILERLCAGGSLDCGGGGDSKSWVGSSRWLGPGRRGESVDSAGEDLQ